MTSAPVEVPQEIREALAQYLWDTAPMRASCPPWEQLGDVTRSVWLERADKQLTRTSPTL